MSKLVSYDSGDESASENEVHDEVPNCKDEGNGGHHSKGKSLENEWHSFNLMIDKGPAQDDLVSYPTQGEAQKLHRVTTDETSKTKSSKDTAKPSSLYDPLNRLSDEDNEGDGHVKDVKLKEANLPKKLHGATERKFREKAEEEKPTDSVMSSSKNLKPIEKKEVANRDEKSRKRDRRDSSSDDSSQTSKKRTSRSHKRLTKNRSRSREKSKEGHRRRHNSRDRSSSRSRRHKHHSSKASGGSSRRSRSRSKSRHRERRRRHEKHRSRSRSRSRSTSHRRPSSRGNPAKTSGPAKAANPKNFKEQLKAMFLQTQGQTMEGIEQEVRLIDKKPLMAIETKNPLLLNNSNPLSLLAMGGAKATPQQALAQTMAAMHAKAQEMTGVEVPKYYNPNAINPIKYAEQLKKRKLLWSKNKEAEKEKEDAKAQAQWSGTSFVADQDGKVAAKFRKLMGIKGEEKPQSDEDLSKMTEEQRKKQEELFQQLAKEYDFARMTTHTCRGVGLGFTTHNLPQS